jgi:hypothetical protein
LGTRKHGDGLTETEWRGLPSIVASPDQVLRDTQTGKLLYIAASSDVGIKLAVEFGYIKKGNTAVNMIVSGFRPKGAPATSEAKLLSWARIREGMQTPP